MLCSPCTFLVHASEVATIKGHEVCLCVLSHHAREAGWLTWNGIELLCLEIPVMHICETQPIIQ